MRWASSRLLMSGFDWRTTAAVPLELLVEADLPRLERASRRAITMARLGLNWAERFEVGRVPLLRRSPRELEGVELKEKAGRLTAGGCGLTGSGVGVETARNELPSRLRSLLVSARLPRLLRASRLARTRSRLGLLMAARLTERDGLVEP